MTPKLDSVAAYNKFGVNTSTVRYMVNNLLYYPHEYKDTLDAYFILLDSTSNFLRKIKDGTIDYKGTTYQIVYHITDPTKIKRRSGYTSVKQSFRIPNKLFNIPPTVLIKEIPMPFINTGVNK